MMEMLNPSAVIVKPRQPYLDWTRHDDAEGLYPQRIRNLPSAEFSDRTGLEDLSSEELLRIKMHGLDEILDRRGDV